MGLMSMVRKGAKVVGKVAKNPLVHAGMSVVPGGGLIAGGIKAAGALSTAYAGYQAARNVVGALKSKGSPVMTAMPTGLPALPGVGGRSTVIAPGQTGGGLNPLKWIPRGPGGRMQLPWNDPSVPAFLKQFALDDSFIRPAMRAPKGYVIIRDADGQPYPVLKKVAQQFHLWKPAKKPPISVGDYQALKRADRTVKKMRKIYATIARVDKATTKGGKVTVHRKAHK